MKMQVMIPLLLMMLCCGLLSVHSYVQRQIVASHHATTAHLGPARRKGYTHSTSVVADENSSTHSSTSLCAGWGNYKSDGKREGKFLFGLITLLVVRGTFITKELRTTTVCPSGYGAERTLAKFQANDPTYHCMPGGELLKEYLTSRWVFPGDPEFDPNWLRIEMRGVKPGGVGLLGNTLLSTQVIDLPSPSLSPSLSPPPSLLPPSPSLAAVREGLGSGAALVSGFGPKDVVYPAKFEGTWHVTQKISAVDSSGMMKGKNNGGNNNNNNGVDQVRFVDRLLKRGPSTLEYDREYIKRPEDGTVVLERASDRSNYLSALMPGDTVVSQWSPSNPNVLTATEIVPTDDDDSKSSTSRSVRGRSTIIQEVKVTKRSQESAGSTREISQSINEEVQMGYSEFSRVSEENTDREATKIVSVPRVVGTRLLARYKYDDSAAAADAAAAAAEGGGGGGGAADTSRIVGVERLYIYKGDVLDLGKDRPDVIVKSTVTMERL